jgi:YaiO family outer membrane protein
VKRFCSVLFFAIFQLSPFIFAQGTSNPAQSGTGAVDTTPNPTVEKKKNQKNSEKTDFHLEVGAFYSPTVPGPGSLNWRGADARLIYSGFKRFTPFGGLSRISTAQGAQYSYGVGSYITFNKWFYSIAGASFAPSSQAEFSPHRRYDVAGLFAVPHVKGMVFSTALTVLPQYRNAGGGRILAFGDIYYWRKFIFGGNANLNFAEPGNRHTVSGQFGATYGTQGKYRVAGGMSGGGAAYMLITGAPFEVQYQTYSAFAMVTKWLTKHSGINCRYDYNRIVGSPFQRHWIRISTFFDF